MTVIAAGKWRIVFECGAGFPRVTDTGSHPLDVEAFGPQAKEKDGRYRLVVWDYGPSRTDFKGRPMLPDGRFADCLSCTCRRRAGRKAETGFFDDNNKLDEFRRIITCRGRLEEKP